MQTIGTIRKRLVNDVSEVFQNLARGCQVFLIIRGNKSSLWIKPPDGSTMLSDYSESVEVINPLIKNELVVKKTIDDSTKTPDAEAFYVLTSKGRELFVAIEREMSEKAKTSKEWRLTEEWNKAFEMKIKWS